MEDKNTIRFFWEVERSNNELKTEPIQNVGFALLRSTPNPPTKKISLFEPLPVPSQEEDAKPNSVLPFSFEFEGTHQKDWSIPPNILLTIFLSELEPSADILPITTSGSKSLPVI